MTKALVLGDFGVAIPLYLSTERYGNAILLGVGTGKSVSCNNCHIVIITVFFSSHTLLT